MTERGKSNAVAQLMGWETRKGRRYYYRKERAGGRVVSEYLGRAEWVDFVAQIETGRRAERQAAQAANCAQREKEKAEDAAYDAIFDQVKALATAVLIASGFHQHKREWRKTRMVKIIENQDKKSGSPLSYDEMIALIKRVDTEKPSEADVKAFRFALRDNPAFWGQTANLLYQAQERIIAESTSTAQQEEVMRFACEELRKELLVTGGSSLERILVDQVVLSWLRVSLIEQSYTAAHSKSISLNQGSYWDKKLTLAHKRFQTACVSLARVQKFQRYSPSLQVNVAGNGGRQVNIGAARMPHKARSPK